MPPTSPGPPRRVLILSPHFDDVPLSLGQSLRDGRLHDCDVTVLVAFGRTNWTQWMHPTRRRARWVGLVRRAEEWCASRRFGYRWRAAGWEEALLRWGHLDPDRLLDDSAALDDDPLVDELASWVRRHARATTPAGAPPDLVLGPAGIGGHVDHRLLALALSRVSAELPNPVGHYEDRPYASLLDADERRATVARLLDSPVPVDVSGPVRGATVRTVQRCYRSQMDGYFREAMAADVRRGAVERVWFRAAEVPAWWA